LEIDIDENQVNFAKGQKTKLNLQFGIIQIRKNIICKATGGHGVDAVISSLQVLVLLDPIEFAGASCCRKKEK